MSIFISVLLLACLVSCGAPDLPTAGYQDIPGRDQKPLYRIKVPFGWKRKAIDGPLEDTTKPLCEFLIEGAVRATIHNFPNIKVPPQAQITRWKKQFSSLDPQGALITPQAFSGYVGLKFEGSGLIEGKKTFIMGWSMQIAPEFYSFVQGQLGSDVTIKVVGPKELIETYREEIERFARSFELIDLLSCCDLRNSSKVHKIDLATHV